jgi:very-short-patch-repair endonuclease
MKYEEIKTIVKKLRNNPTKEEEFLWRSLSNRQLLGRKFIRQSAIIYEKNTHGEYFFYVPDFYCREEKLAVELDGKIHDYQIERDTKRDEILSSQGIRVLRIKNEELNQIQHVLDRIKACFCDRELRYRQIKGRKQT